MTDLSKKKDNLSILPAYQFYAIKQRYKGIPYKEITTKIGEIYGVYLGNSTVRCWFWKNGVLQQQYREYADLMIQLEFEECRDFIRGNVSKAAKTLARVMSGDGNAAMVMAAKEFLDRGLGKVKEEVEHSGGIVVAPLRDLLEAYETGQLDNTKDREMEKQSE